MCLYLFDVVRVQATQIAVIQFGEDSFQRFDSRVSCLLMRLGPRRVMIADEVAEQALEMTIFEDFVMETVRSGRSILGLYPPTDEQSLKDFDAWRQENGL